MDVTELRALRKAVSMLRAEPGAVQRPELAFLREYLVSLGAALPLPPAAVVTDSESDTSGSELDCDLLPRVDVSAADRAPFPPRGDPTAEVSAAAAERAADLKRSASEVLSSGDAAEAMHALTDAVLLNPRSAMLYGARAAALLALGRPRAALADCDEALRLNADYARAKRCKGEALAALGRWEDAHRELQSAARMDYDDETLRLLSEVVGPRVERINARRAAVRRRRSARADRREARMSERLRAEAAQRRAAAKAAYDAEHEIEAADAAARGDGALGDEVAPGARLGGGGGHSSASSQAAGKLPGMDAEGMRGLANVDLSAMWGDADVQAALRDPALTPLVTDVLRNPANAARYAANPRMATILRKCLIKAGAEEAAKSWTHHCPD